MNGDGALPAGLRNDPQGLRGRIEDFLYLEAELLDEWKIEEWFALFAEGATYEVPPTGSPATGFATIKYLSSLGELTYDVTYSGLLASATASHLHFSPAGLNGPVVLFLLPAPSGTSGEITGTLTDADVFNAATTDSNAATTLAGALSTPWRVTPRRAPTRPFGFRNCV